MTLDCVAGPVVITRVLLREAGGIRISEGDVMTEQKERKLFLRCDITGFEDGGKDRDPRNAGSFQRKQRFSPRGSGKEPGPASTLMSGLLASRNERVVFQDTESVVFCYGNKRKLTQRP